MGLVRKIFSLIMDKYIEEVKTYGLESEIEENHITILRAFEEWVLTEF